jgi:hypothetical protein
MDDKSFTIRVSKRWVRISMIVAATALIVAPLTAIATHTFNDVPNSHTFHNDIAWLEASGVTKGCNPPTNNLYCPDDFVTRGQMAAFMERFAGYLGAKDGTPAQADNADTVDGFDAADLVSNVWVANHFVETLAAGTTTEVLTLDIPPGTYLLTATGTLNNNAGSVQQARCGLEAGGKSIVGDSSNYKLAPDLQGGERLDWTYHLVVDVNSTTTATVSCTTSAGWSGNVVQTQIVALSVQSAIETAQDLSSAGGDTD